jgi:hypothetical protein
LYQLGSLFIPSISTPRLICGFLILAIALKLVFEKCETFAVFAAGAAGID